MHFSSYEQSLSDVQRNSWTHMLLWQYWYSGQLELLLQVGWQSPLIQSWSPIQSLVFPQSAASYNNQIMCEIYRFTTHQTLINFPTCRMGNCIILRLYYYSLIIDINLPVHIPPLHTEPVAHCESLLQYWSGVHPRFGSPVPPGWQVHTALWLSEEQSAPCPQTFEREQGSTHLWSKHASDGLQSLW